MTTTAEVALSYQMALRNQLDVTANNIANMSTSGFQGSQPLFAEFLVEIDSDGNEISYVEDSGTLRNTAPGPLNATGNQLDIGLQGEGYFVVESAGEFLYTRNGSFRLDDSGRLTTSGGNAVLDDRDNPIVVSPGETFISISRDGVVRTENGEIGRLRIVTFANQQDMELLGNSLLRTNQVPIDAAGTEVVQGMLEGSNVIAITEMTRMIDLLRSYQSANQLITSDEDRQEQAIDILTRIV
ncbi:MAG: flagellar basal-body rod protein FlgF [Alphaproteobacteria bacterium]|nr:flagellar basal-body rod protein FlgF [Alphaproteobacteria bacterium]